MVIGVYDMFGFLFLLIVIKAMVSYADHVGWQGTRAPVERAGTLAWSCTAECCSASMAPRQLMAGVVPSGPCGCQAR